LLRRCSRTGCTLSMKMTSRWFIDLKLLKNPFGRKTRLKTLIFGLF
jgi:hypothetical protein